MAKDCVDFYCCARKSPQLFVGFLHEALFDASLLAGEATKVVELSAANLSVLVDYDGVNER